MTPRANLFQPDRILDESCLRLYFIIQVHSTKTRPFKEQLPLCSNRYQYIVIFAVHDPTIWYESLGNTGKTLAETSLNSFCPNFSAAVTV